jgi:hypothetical protein
VTAGDFNGDGRLDLAVANSFVETVSVLLGDGAGSFAAAAHYPGGSSITAGDFNGDGLVDMAVASYRNDVRLLQGIGTGAFPSPPTTYIAGDTPRFVLPGDFNADGRLDLAAATTSGVAILLNDAD